MNSALELSLNDLVSALAEVERDMQDATLSHSDQQVLDQAWDYYTEQIAAVEELLASQYNDLEDSRGCGLCSGCLSGEESAPGYDPADEV